MCRHLQSVCQSNRLECNISIPAAIWRALQMLDLVDVASAVVVVAAAVRTSALIDAIHRYSHHVHLPLQTMVSMRHSSFWFFF